MARGSDRRRRRGGERSTLPASEVSAPFGMRIATGGMCSNESGIESRRTFMEFPTLCKSYAAGTEGARARGNVERTCDAGERQVLDSDAATRAPKPGALVVGRILAQDDTWLGTTRCARDDTARIKRPRDIVRGRSGGRGRRRWPSPGERASRRRWRRHLPALPSRVPCRGES